MVVGIVGYCWIEGLSLFDLLYMMVIIFLMVGYGEVELLSFVGRFFLIVLIMVGLGVVFYMVGVVVEFFFEGWFEFILGECSMKC